MAVNCGCEINYGAQWQSIGHQNKLNRQMSGDKGYDELHMSWNNIGLKVEIKGLTCIFRGTMVYMYDLFLFITTTCHMNVVFAGSL